MNSYIKEILKRNLTKFSRWKTFSVSDNVGQKHVGSVIILGQKHVGSVIILCLKHVGSV